MLVLRQVDLLRTD